MVLHLVQRSPYQHTALQDCLNLCSEGDSILLMEDGVLGHQHPSLADIPSTVYALDDDVNARGIDLSDAITPCSYDKFVALCQKHTQVISWF